MCSRTLSRLAMIWRPVTFTRYVTRRNGQASGLSHVACSEKPPGEGARALPPTARAALSRVAMELAVRMPATEVVETRADLARWFGQHRGPAVLKTDGSGGGRGVRIVDTLADAWRAWQALTAPPTLRRAIKRTIVNGDATYLLPCLRRTRAVVNVQRFVAGEDANCTVACWEGRVLAAITVRVLQTLDASGPASVVQLIEHREMAEAVSAIVCHLKISGVVGFDFILEEGTEHAHLIEMNPRATQMSHLPLGPGRDVAASLYAALSGQTVRERSSVTAGDVIALFPQEWLRDPASVFLTTAHHDVPWDEPDLVRACVNEGLAHRVYGSLLVSKDSMRARLSSRGVRIMKLMAATRGLEAREGATVPTGAALDGEAGGRGNR